MKHAGTSGFDEECLSLLSVKSPALALRQFQNQMISGGLRQHISINCKSETLFQDNVSIYKRANQDLRRRPDAGGPTLELLWLALSQMKNGDSDGIILFEGASYGHFLSIHPALHILTAVCFIYFERS